MSHTIHNLQHHKYTALVSPVDRNSAHCSNLCEGFFVRMFAAFP